MVETALPQLAAWETFYLIVGTAGGALTGLMFVVVALGADSRSIAGETDVSVFGTPTIVHFCVVLLVSSLVSAPFRHPVPLAGCLGATAVAGLAYVGSVVRLAGKKTAYQPVFEDWLWHAALPPVRYLGLLISAVMLPRSLGNALFGVGAVAVLLLFIGIHNAWDAATWMAIQRRQEDSPAAANEADPPVAAPE